MCMNFYSRELFKMDFLVFEDYVVLNIIIAKLLNIQLLVVCVCAILYLHIIFKCFRWMNARTLILCIDSLLPCVYKHTCHSSNIEA